MAICEHTQTRPKSRYDRRTLLASAPAAAAVVALPAGGAMALAVIADADPGLARLEQGYIDWRQLFMGSLEQFRLARELHDRARSDRPMLEPEPVPPPELAEWFNGSGMNYPNHLHEEIQAFHSVRYAWFGRRPSLDGHPGYEESTAAERRAEGLFGAAYELRRELIAVPTWSPRGVLLKLAIAVEARDIAEMVADFPKAMKRSGVEAEEILPALFVDMQAMVERDGP